MFSLDSEEREIIRAKAWLLSGPPALGFVLMEMMKAHRASTWWGVTSGDLVGVGLGAVLYFTAIAFMGHYLGRALYALSGRRLPAEYAALFAVCLGAGGLWTLLSQFREFTPTLEDGLVLAALLGFAGFVIAARWRGHCARSAAVVAGLSLGAGLAALWAAGWYFLLSPQRADAVTLTPIIWIALAGLVHAWAWAANGRGRWPKRALAAVATLAGPPLLALGATWTPARGDDAPPNLVLVISDTLRADILDVHGGPAPTPNLARLASKGAVFERAYALGPWTPPSMAGMFSSAYPPGLTPNVDPDIWLDQLWRYETNPEAPALAALLRERGYATGAFIGNALAWTLPHLLSDFEHRAYLNPMGLTRPGLFNHMPFLQAALEGLAPPLVNVRPRDSTPGLHRYAEAFLRRHRNQPFFLWIHYIDPHTPNDPPQRYRSLRGPWPFFYPYEGGEAWGIPRLAPDFDLPEDAREYVRSLYVGEVRYIDEHMGRLLDTLDRLGLSGQTYLCFTSDHGEELWDHGRWGHGQSVYEELMRVPLLLRGPDVAPLRIADPMSAIDLFPTFADLLDVDAPPAWRGESLAPLLRGAAPPALDRMVFGQGTSNAAAPEPLQMVVSGQYKLIREAGSGATRLFDLEADPGETRDIAAVQPDIAAALEAALIAWEQSFDAHFEVDPGAMDRALEDDALEHLRGMGYL